MRTETTAIIANIAANAPMNEMAIIKQEIQHWLSSDLRKMMLEGNRYYRNKTDALKRKRMVIGQDGISVEDKNLANNKIVHGFLRKLTDQKVGYLLSKPMSLKTKNEAYQALLEEIFNKSFARTLKNLGKKSIIKGKEWLHPYYDEVGNFSVEIIPSEECIPQWKDSAHTILDAMIRFYDVETYVASEKRIVKKIEYWDTKGVRRYIDKDGSIVPDAENVESSHMMIGEEPFNWNKVPFICFKYNDEEQPLLELVKSLIDDYDNKKSDNSNNLEDLPNSIFVIENFDGADLGEFRRNLSQFRAVKTRSGPNGGGGKVDTLNLEIDTEAFKTHMEMTRKNIYEFGRGVDMAAEKFNGATGVALKQLYNDLDMDANDMETEFQAALEQFLWFVNQHLLLITKGDFTTESVDVIFNRDILTSESDVITDGKNSVGLISNRTIISNHPWVTNAAEEEEQMKKEKEEAFLDAQSYGGLKEDEAPIDGGGGDE
ncbi:phage portal protein [Cohnella abietis]|uniref:Portal protein n=1 Tax=Cohnella abietis TaxID=2507935 RepID=A0A3T1D1U9_9BACL|nr:phage portal protein [Cohnella abietis]BBI32031.1 portal protein [Cohnella abietis]